MKSLFRFLLISHIHCVRFRKQIDDNLAASAAHVNKNLIGIRTCSIIRTGSPAPPGFKPVEDGVSEVLGDSRINSTPREILRRENPNPGSGPDFVIGISNVYNVESEFNVISGV
jgi:hypothetical protein